MKFVVRGRTVVGEAKKGVFGSIIQVFDAYPSLCDAKLLQSLITNRDGEFSFRLWGQVIAEAAKGQKPIYLQAYDAEAQALSDPYPVAVVPGQDLNVQLVVKPENISNAVLPPQPGIERVVPTAVFDTIDLAINTSVESAGRENARLAARNYYCTLPPIANLEDILDVAQGVLRGQPEDMRTFDAYLDNMEVWNQRTNPGPRRLLTDDQAALLLSDEFLEGLSKRMSAKGSRSHQGGVVPMQNGITLMMAAMRSAANDPVRLHRNLGIVLEQLCGLRGLDLLHGAALGALSSIQAERGFFLHTLGLMSGFCEPGDLPGSVPPRPSAIPCGNPFWPPDPGEPGIPMHPGIFEYCTPEAVRALREVLARRVVYTIDNVTPSNACPGQEIVIRGSNFQFEGRPGIVLFPGRPRGTKVRAAPASYSATEIRVAVPEGGTCGDLELEIPGGAATILVCDATVELFHGPAAPFRFIGGATTIEFFANSALDGCLGAGDEVIFRWSTCNADSIALQISSDDDVSLFSDTIEDGHFVFTVPVLERDTRVTATLIADGPCGTDEERIHFIVRRGTPLSLSEFISFASTQFSNWHGNHRRSVVGMAMPINLDQLVRAVQTAERLGQRIGVQGSAWSYTDCVVPRRTTGLMVDIAALGAELTFVLPAALRTGVRSVLSASVERELRASFPVFSPIESRLVHVGAGIKIHALNCLLDGKSPALALPTMGGDMGQSLAGAINTGTHGANAKLPPIADFVRAIHLVGPGAQQWWIEPASNPVTNGERMELLKADGTLNPCLKVIYDDATFAACLVSVGSTGIVVAYVIEAIDAHNLISTTTGLSWEVAKEEMLRRIVEPRDLPEPWFLEVTVNPTRQARLTTRAITTAPVPPPLPPSSGPEPIHVALLGFLFGPEAVGAVPAIIGFGTGAVAGLMGALPFYIARRTAEIIRYLTNPFEWHRIVEIREEIELIERLTDTLTSLTRAIARGGREADLAEVIPNLLNVIWQIGLYVVDGRTIVETAQNIFTNRNQRPEGTTIQKSYVAMTGQVDCAISTSPPTPSPGLLPPAHHSAFERLIESAEYALPAEQCIAFADDVLGFADRVRRTNDAIIVILNLRFTQPTRALIGMQQFTRTGHVEVYTVRGLAGNEDFHRELQALAAEHRAIPHWGQFHDGTRDFEALFGMSLQKWRSVMDRLSREGRGPLNTFRHDFVLRRGLLTEI